MLLARAVQFCIYRSVLGCMVSAAANVGIQSRLFKQHERWRSENMKDIIDSRLKVSKNLELYLLCQG